MANSYQDKVCEQIRSYIQRQMWEIDEAIEFNAVRFNIRYGKSTAVVKVYNTTGTIQIQASPASTLKDPLEKLKKAIENDQVLPDELPFEIESFPQILHQNIPSIDVIIVQLLSEAILCFKANALLGCAFLLGAASEKAIWVLMEAYIQAISDPTNRANFENRVRNRYISRAYDEFKRSFQSSKSKPSDPALVYDLDTQVEAMFQFYRICRNEVGHPHFSPNFDKGVLMANLAQFVKYAEAIHRLINYFENNEVVL